MLDRTYGKTISRIYKDELALGENHLDDQFMETTTLRDIYANRPHTAQ